MSAPLVKQQAGNAALWVGTSGYSYPEWVEAGIYPSGTKAGEMLPLYAREFPVTELNTTWYQMPQAESIERQRSLVPPNFLFSAKLTRSLTHEVDPKAWQGEVAKYRVGIAPLLQSRQLLAVLIQFGGPFDRSSKNRAYLGALLSELDGLPLAVEFRNSSWADDKVFAELARRRVSLVTVDAPELDGLFPSLDVVTNPDLFYVRFHAGPYAVPKADLNQPGMIDRPPRPSVGDVLLLAILQVAGIAVTRILLRVLFGVAWSGYPIAGAVVGAAIFGALEKLHRPKASSLAYVFFLALWSTVPWILISSASMVVFYRTSYHAQSQALWWLVPARRVLLAGVLSFAATFVGALIGTRGGTGPRRGSSIQAGSKK